MDGTFRLSSASKLVLAIAADHNVVTTIAAAVRPSRPNELNVDLANSPVVGLRVQLPRPLQGSKRFPRNRARTETDVIEST